MQWVKYSKVWCRRKYDSAGTADKVPKPYWNKLCLSWVGRRCRYREQGLPKLCAKPSSHNPHRLCWSNTAFPLAAGSALCPHHPGVTLLPQLCLGKAGTLRSPTSSSLISEGNFPSKTQPASYSLISEGNFPPRTQPCLLHLAVPSPQSCHRSAHADVDWAIIRSWSFWK